MDRPTRSDWFWLAAILALAAALRVPGLNGPLWYDEILTVDTHLRLPWGEMMRAYSMNHHYLHDVFAKASMTVFGDAAWAIRLPAMLLGLGAIAAMWWLALSVAGRGAAHATALLLALSYHHIWFSQNARGYTGLAFFSTVGMILFLRGIERPRPGTWLLYGLMLAAAVFTHLTGAFFFAAQGLIWLAVLVARRGTPGWRALALWPLAGFALGAVLTVLAYLPILPGILEAARTVSDTSAVDVMQEYQSPLWTVIEAVRTGIGTAGPAVVIAALVALGLASAGALALRGRAPWFAPTVALHIGLTMALLLAVGTRIWPRFFFVDIGFLMLLIVAGVQATSQWLARRMGRSDRGPSVFALAVVAMVLLSGALAARNYRAPKQDLAGAFALAQENRRPGERIYALGPAALAFRDHFGADWGTIDDDASYRAAMAQPGPVTLVVAFPGRMLRRVPALDADLKSGLTLLRRFPGTLGDGAVLVIRRD